MKKKEIIASLISITVGAIILAVGWHKLASTSRNNLISCKHVDENIDMICDSCGASLSFKAYAFEQELKKSISGDETIQAKGDMLSGTELVASKLENADTIALAKKHIPTLKDEDIIAGYDISMLVNNMKFEPKKYGESVNISIDGLSVKDKENMAMLHILGDFTYEIIPLDSFSKNKIGFNATSFSTYILVTLGTYSVTFSGDGDVTILDQYGVELKNNSTIDGGTNFTFTIVSNDGYELKGATLANSGVATISGVGNGYGKTFTVKNITSNLTININTIELPMIVSNPKTQKIKDGSSASFSVTGENVKKVVWEYRESGDAEWKSTNEVWGYSMLQGTTSTFSTGTVSEDKSGYQLRALLYAETTSTKPTISESAMLIAMQDVVTVDIRSTLIPEHPIIITSRPAGVWGYTDVSFTMVNGGNLPENQTLQYKIGNGAWTDYLAETVINTEGTTLLYGRAINADDTRYISEEVVVEIKIDKTTPYITVNKITDSSVEFNASDTLSGVVAWAVTDGTTAPKNKVTTDSVSGDKLNTWYSVSGIATPMDLSFEGLSLGTYYIWLKDRAGNVCTPKDITIYKDIMAPIGSLKIVGNEVDGATYVNNTTVKLIITATDNVTDAANLKMKILNKEEFDNLKTLNDIVWEDYKNEVTWQIPSNDGVKRVYLLLKDEAGNISLSL